MEVKADQLPILVHAYVDHHLPPVRLKRPPIEAVAFLHYGVVVSSGDHQTVPRHILMKAAHHSRTSALFRRPKVGRNARAIARPKELVSDHHVNDWIHRP
jgi:hypothetical protein